jgi:CheY-like chemotaxis protein
VDAPFAVGEHDRPTVSSPPSFTPTPGTPGESPTPAARPALPAPDLRGLRVLVVEDDHDALGLVERILTGAGATVATANSASKALSRLDGQSFDVIVSDIAMAGMDGYTLLREVRKREDLRGVAITPALALTAYDGMRHMLEAARAGFQQYLAKPIDPERLVSIVAELAVRP